MPNISPIPSNIIEMLARFCGEINTGSEISMLLQLARLSDSNPQNTKWKRLYNSFAIFQEKHRASDRIITYLKLALDPARYTNSRDLYLTRIGKVNPILAFIGLEFHEDGKMHRVDKAETLSEAVLRAQRLRTQLEQRNVHPDILKFAEAEIASDNYFHTVLEGMKSVTAKIRDLTGICADGSELIDNTLQGKNRCLAINPLKTASEQSEQNGFANLLKGLYGTFRNPTAHEPKIQWPLSEADALDVLSVLSYIHRKLDAAHRI